MTVPRALTAMTALTAANTPKDFTDSLFHSTAVVRNAGRVMHHPSTHLLLGYSSMGKSGSKPRHGIQGKGRK